MELDPPSWSWLSRGVRPHLPGPLLRRLPRLSPTSDDERILCAYFMSPIGGGGPTTMDIEGVYYVEED